MSIYDEKFGRNPLTRRQQDRLRRSVFAIVGLGGTGGYVFENLLRMGAENFILFDNDRFDLSNFNRQTLATEEFIDMPKVHAALSRAQSVNQDIRIEPRGAFDEGSDTGSAAVLIDGSDNLRTKLAMARSARKKKIPYVFSSAQGTRGIVSVFTSYRFEKAFQLPPDEDSLERYGSCSSVLCPAASLSGSLAASQAANYMLRKPYVKAPDALFFDLFREDVFWRAELG
ncbi:MAG: ThiF family adenylyltransferase [Candidatus Micrarchaeia archaeon]